MLLLYLSKTFWFVCLFVCLFFFFFFWKFNYFYMQPCASYCLAYKWQLRPETKVQLKICCVCAWQSHVTNIYRTQNSKNLKGFKKLSHIDSKDKKKEIPRHIKLQYSSLSFKKSSFYLNSLNHNKCNCTMFCKLQVILLCSYQHWSICMNWYLFSSSIRKPLNMILQLGPGRLRCFSLLKNKVQ